jgi:hypothetical protein
VKQNRRSAILLALLAIVFVAWLRYGSPEAGGSGAGPSALPPIDAAGLAGRLAAINTVNPDLIAEPEADLSSTRNLFQYGERRPPPPQPPDPAEVERQRRAAEAALQQAEEEARRRKEQQEAMARAAAEQARLLAEQQAREQPVPQDQARAQKPPPPPIQFKYIGVFGPSRGRIGVLLDGTEPILVKRGQIVKDQFRVLSVDSEWADVGYVDPDYKDQKQRLYLGS